MYFMINYRYKGLMMKWNAEQYDSLCKWQPESSDLIDDEMENPPSDSNTNNTNTWHPFRELM